MDRKECMNWYIWEVCDKKKRITLQNMAALIKYDLIPQELVLNKKIFEFNRYLKAVCKKSQSEYKLDNRAVQFLVNIEHDDLIYGEMNLDIKDWEKVYQRYMDNIRDWINSNKDSILISLNNEIFKEEWDKYAKGSLSAWEMEVLCFYYHEHELKNVNKNAYGFTEFSSIPENPIVEKTFKTRGGHEVKMFKLYKICGTCIAKNKTKSTVTLLTTDGVVNVKFRKEYFSLFDKQISEKQPDGSKKVAEKSWFNRGNMIVVQGIRQGDDFVTKKYASIGGHQLYRIEKIFDDGSIQLIDHRHQGGIENG
jgi:DNA polymerase-3 subunit alpha